MGDKDKLVCPVCGTGMNHHANKIDYGAADDDEAGPGGVLIEAHTCPGCGRPATRRAGAGEGFGG